MNEINDSMLDEQLRGALGSPANADFDQWRQRHGDALAHLNPVVTEGYRRRRRVLVRIVTGAIAAALMVSALVWSLGPQQPSFAETVKVLTEAKSITWTVTSYLRYQSKDGKQTWLKSNSSKFAYLQPGLVRQEEYDDKGNKLFITTVDARSEKTKFLVLNVKQKKTDPQLRLHFGGPMPTDGPFGYVVTTLAKKPVELVGQRQVDGKTANVFRFRGEKTSSDIWIDARTKEYVGGCNPSSDVFDPETAPDRHNPPQKKFGTASSAGTVTHDINFNAQLDPGLFSLTPPAGFEVVAPPIYPPITETQMVEWLGLMARVNNDTFVDRPLVMFDNERIKRASTRVWVADMKKRKVTLPPEKDKEAEGDPSEIEKKIVKDFQNYQLSRQYATNKEGPFADFIKEETVPDSFRYLGKGVKLGAPDRIVCWYKLKSTGKYRAVYGDLHAKDVKPEDLPMAVEK